MKIETRALELREAPAPGVEKTPDFRSVEFDVPEGALNVTASTVPHAGTFFLVVTWMIPTADELRELKYQQARASQGNGGRLV